MDRYFNANAVISVFCKNYMDLKKDLPIRPSEMGVLNIITETEGPYTPVMLAKMLHISKPMITAHINVLEGKGYVTKEASIEDKRAYYILPTTKAKELVIEVKRDLDSKLMLLEENIGQDKFDEMVSILKSVNEILEVEE